MGVLSQISAGMVRDTGDGRRVFHHGLWPARKRSVVVTAVEERRLRRTYEWGVVLTVAAIALSGPFLPFWFRLAVIVPASTVALEAALRRMTATLPPAPEPVSPLTFSNVVLAAAPAETLLWVQLVFFAAFAALCASSLVSYEDMGWRKYAGMAIGVAMVVQVSYQLVLRRTRLQKENGRQ
jgi:hypothetical protein